MLRLAFVLLISLFAWPAGAQTLELVCTGMGGGITHNSFDLSEFSPLFEPTSAFEHKNFQISQNAFRNGSFILFNPQGTVDIQELEPALRNGELKVVGDGQETILLRSSYTHLLQYPQPEGPWLTQWLDEMNALRGTYPDQKKVRARLFEVRTPSGASWRLMSLTGKPPGSILQSTRGWEILFTAKGTVSRDMRDATYYAFGRSYGNGNRRNTQTHRLLAEHPQALLVDVGNLVEGGTQELEKTSRHLTLQALERLNIAAAVPYKNELALSDEEFDQLAERVPFVAANLKRHNQQMTVAKVVTAGDLKIGFVGIADEYNLREHGLLGGTWTATPAVQAARLAVRAVRANQPDAIVLLTNMRGERLQSLLDQVDGFSFVISSQFSGVQGDQVRLLKVDTPLNTRTQRAPWVIGVNTGHVGLVQAEFEVAHGKTALKTLEERLIAIHDDLPPDPELEWEIAKKYAYYLKETNGPLLPDARQILAKNPNEMVIFEEASWSRMVAALLRRELGAEIGISRRAGLRGSVVGEVPEFVVETWADTIDHPLTITLTGEELLAMANIAKQDHTLGFAGFDPDKQLVRGRQLEPAARYQVATTDTVVKNPLFANLFPHPPQAEPQHVRDLILGKLRTLKLRHQGFNEAYVQELKQLFEDDGQGLEPQLLFKVQDLSLRFNSISGFNNDSFSQVRNSRITAPNNMSLGGGGKLSVTYDTSDLAWENRFSARYNQLTLTKDTEQITQKADDDWRLDSEFRLKFIRLDVKDTDMEFVPFVSTGFDSQFTPDEVDGQFKPLQRELDATFGVLVYPKTLLKEVRLGGLARYDLAAVQWVSEPGMQFGLLLEQPLGNMLARTQVDLKHWFRTPQDTPDKLGLLANLKGSLMIPIWEQLALELSMDVLGFSGKTAETDKLGWSLSPSVGLSYTASWKPAFGVLY